MAGATEKGTNPTSSNQSSNDLVRLQKLLAQAGFGSRRVCDELIATGRVLVNGTPAVPGKRVNPYTDTVAVDDVEVSVLPDLVYYLLNKTTGVVTTATDTHDRPTVLDNLPPEPRVFPVGRLDMDTEGVLVITNDGPLAHRLTHPSFGVPKTYMAQVKGNPSPACLRQLRQGVELSDGITAPAKVSLLKPNMLRITVHEGRNRLIRRMCEQVGHPVLRLVRYKFGPLTTGKLAPGEWRLLTNSEIKELRGIHKPQMEAIAGS